MIVLLKFIGLFTFFRGSYQKQKGGGGVGGMSL